MLLQQPAWQCRVLQCKLHVDNYVHFSGGGFKEIDKSTRKSWQRHDAVAISGYASTLRARESHVNTLAKCREPASRSAGTVSIEYISIYTTQKFTSNTYSKSVIFYLKELILIDSCFA